MSSPSLQLQNGKTSLLTSHTSEPPAPRPPFSAFIAQSFAAYGRYLSTHQIAFLLLSSVVICSLFFPTLSLYFSPDGPASQVARRGRGSMVWELQGIKRQGVISSEDEVCWDRLARYYDTRGQLGRRAKVVRMEQILITPSVTSRSGALSKRTLHQTLQLQSEILRRLLSGMIPGLTCIRSFDEPEQCAVSSPGNYWTSESDLLADFDIHHTLSLAANTSSTHSIPLTLSNTLVGVGRDRFGSVKGAHYLAMTFYLEDTSADLVLTGIGSSSEEWARTNAKREWRKMIRDVIAGIGWEGDEEREQMGKVGEGRGLGRRVILKYLPNLPLQNNPRLFEDAIFAVAYLAVVIYVVWWTRRLDHVYSRIGLAFTGLVQLITTGIISISICWLFGLSVALVPWKSMPFLVIVLGIDNMFVLLNAITGTDISLPVPARVGAGLKSIGMYTTVTLVVELLTAGVLLRMVAIPVIQQLVVFAAVALTVDHCMEMTFFTTVLSIDIQRLELADLLRQGRRATLFEPISAGFSQTTSSPCASSSPSHSATPTVLWSKIWPVLRARIARTITFTLLVVINVLLYSAYGADHYLPAFCSETALSNKRSVLSPSLSSEFGTSSSWGRRGPIVAGEEVHSSAGEQFWRLINPANSTSVHVYVEPVSLVQFYGDALVAPESASATIVSAPLWIEIATFLAPIAGVTFVLYFLLRQLLKGADLIDRGRSCTSEAMRGRQKRRGDAKVRISALRKGHASDVELIASARDRIVSWSGLEEYIAVWTMKSSTSAAGAAGAVREGSSIFELSRKLSLTSGSVTHLSIDRDAQFCAASSQEGVIILWSLNSDDSSFKLPPSTSSPIVHLFPSLPLDLDPLAPPISQPTAPCPVIFFSTHTDGSVVLHNCTTRLSSIILSPAPATNIEARLQTFVVPFSTCDLAGDILFARANPSGYLEVYCCCDEVSPLKAWESIFNMQVTLPADPITCLSSISSSDDDGATRRKRRYLSIGTASGAVSMYDLDSRTMMASITEMDGPIRKLRSLATSGSFSSSPSSPKGRCSICSEVMQEGFLVVCSTAKQISVFHIVTSSPSLSSTSPSSVIYCTCDTSMGIPVSALISSSASKAKRQSFPESRSRDEQQLSVVNNTPFRPRQAIDSLLEPLSVDLLLRNNEASAGFSQERSPSVASSNSSTYSSLPHTPLAPFSLLPRSASSTFDTSLRPSSSSTRSRSSQRSPDVPFVREVLTIESDERGGWDVLDGAVVGVRRKMVAKEDKDLRLPPRTTPSRAWEVWTLDSTDSSFAVRTRSMEVGENLGMEAMVKDESEVCESSVTDWTSSSLKSTMRRRNLNSSSSLGSSSSQISSPNATLNGRASSLSDIALPFSRARPIVSVLGGRNSHSLAVGLGNQIAILTPIRPPLTSTSLLSSSPPLL